MADSISIETNKEDVKVPESRKDVIAAAVAAATVEDKPVEDKKDEKPTEKSVEKPAEDSDKELAEQGKQLMQALKDPNKAPLVIKFLAEQAGYTKAPETKAEVKETKEDILSMLKESLGEEFSVVAERLAPGIEKILNKQKLEHQEELKQSQADIRAEFQRQEAEKLQQQSATAMTKLAEDFFGKGEIIPDNVGTEMSKYMDRVPPTANMSVKEYVEDAFNVAIGKLGINKSDKVKQERTNKNRTDAPSRIASDRAPAESNIQRDNSKPLSRQEAIKLAIEAASKE